MKIRSVAFNNRKKAFEVRSGRERYPFPYAKADPPPAQGDLVTQVSLDTELAREAFTFELESGRQGTVHLEQVLEYNQDPGYMRDLLLYRLTLEAQALVKASPLSKREIIRRLGTSPAQFYRILDQANYRKSIDQVLKLLHLLDCRVDLVVKRKRA